MSSIHRRIHWLGILLTAVGLLTGRFVLAQSNEFRALWVDGFSPGFKTSDQVTQLISDVRTGNFNAIVVEIRKRGDAYYSNSIYEPRASDISSTFDPLLDMITKAHDTNNGPYIEVHPWIVTYPIWNIATSAPPASVPPHPYNAHPDWLTLDSTGANWDGQSYLFDPGHPEVQKHIFNVAMDIISRYDVDGFNLDYVRYSGKAWGYNPVAVQRFKTQYKRSDKPPTTDPAWLQFRRDQVTGLMRKIYLSAIALKPRLKISADTVCFAPGVTDDSGWTNSAAAYTDKLQDWRSWMQEGILDLNLPMMYFDQTNWASAWTNWSIFAKNHRYNRHVALGPAIYLNIVSNSIFQIRTSRDPTSSSNRADGISAYCYDETSDDGLSRATFLSALTKPSSYDSITPPVFSQAVATPVMTWKTAPTNGHIKGFAYNGGTTTGLDGAKVTLTNLATLAYRIQTNDATGFYGFVDLAPGSYRITASFPGLDTLVITNSVVAGAVTTSDLYLPIPSQPAIVTQPEDLNVLVGGDATFTVSANGTPPLSYQWRFNGTDIPGATRTSFTRTNVTFADAGSYSVVVTNGLGSATSDPAILTVVSTVSPPLLIAYPQGQTVLAGATATLTTAAQGTLPLAYQWSLNGTNLAGATNAVLTLTNVQSASAGDYTVTVSNDGGSDISPPATLNVNYFLAVNPSNGGVVTPSPNQAAYTPGTVVSLTASPSGAFTGWAGDASGSSNPLIVTMNSNKTITANFNPTDIIVDNVNATLTGSWSTGTSAGYFGINYNWKSQGSGASYVRFTPALPIAGSYQVYEWHVQGGNRTTNAPHVITYSGGTQTIYVNQNSAAGTGSQWNLIGTFPFAAGASGNVRITDGFLDAGQVVMADAIRFLLVSPPVITAQPQTRTVLVGQNAAFSVTAAGSGLAYQWQFNGGNIAGATTSAYTRTNAQPADEGVYSVVVTNAFGAATSLPANLTVVLPASITTQPQSQTNNHGDTVTFSIAAAGTPPLSYRWCLGGAYLPGATNSNLVLDNVQPADGGDYTVVINNCAGAVVSSNATLSVRTPPVILTQPADQTLDPGATAIFAVRASGTAPLFYQWQCGGADLPGATDSSYTRTNVQAADAGVYSVVVSNAAGVDISDPAVLSIRTPAVVHIDSITLLPDRQVQLQISGGPGGFAIEVAPDLSNWTTLDTLTATEAVFQYTDPQTNELARFYRVRVLP